jgi:hypothetical protein
MNKISILFNIYFKNGKNNENLYDYIGICVSNNFVCIKIKN